MQSLLLLYPPVAKNCEPPAGIARLAGFLRGNGITCSTHDLNRQALDYLLGLDCHKTDTWSRRAKKNLWANITSLQERTIYTNLSKYKRAVADVNRVLAGVGEPFEAEITLANYQDNTSPVKSKALLESARAYEENIFYPLYERVVTRALEESKADVVGISLAYLSQAVPAFALIGFLRARFPGCKIILGGGLVTSWLRSPLWKNPFSGLVDAHIAGPGEIPLFKLLSGKRDETHHHPPQYDWRKYLSPGFILPYAASSGCYWNKCLFCPETAEGNPYLQIAPEQVSQDLKILCKQYHPLLIHFLDNAVSPALMNELVINPPGVPWYGFARASQQLADVDFCKKLYTSGCIMLKLGLESGDQNVLDAMQKGIELSMVSQVLSSLQSAGIMSYVYLLFGTPSEDEVSARKTMEFTVRHHDAIGFLNLAIFNLPQAGPEANRLVVKDFYGGDLSLYSDFVHPKGWSRQKIRFFLSKEFKRHPLIAPIVQRDPPVFTSNHAALFHPTHFINSLQNGR